MGNRVKGDVFKDGTEADGTPYLGLVFLGELDALGITAALEVEYAVGTPSMLVVADQQALGVGRKRGFPSPGKPKEKGGVAMPAYVGRAMHGKHIAVGQQEVHHAKDGLLHLACIFCSADEDDLAGKVDDDKGFGARAVPLRVSLKFRSGDNGKFRHISLHLFGAGTHKQGANEEVMPCKLVNDAYR